MTSFLSDKDRSKLKKSHKQEHLRRYAGRIKAILLLDAGRSYEKVAEALLLDDQTVRNYETTYQDKGIEGLLTDHYIGCIPKLNSEQEFIEQYHQLKNEKSPEASVIYIISDNARYYRAKLVKTYLENSRIQLVFLPPYLPNLNLIERVWRFFHEEILYNTYLRYVQKV